MGELGQSTFTRHLVTGLQTGEADLDGDGRITLDDWYHYVRDRVGEESARQTPQLFKIRQSGDVVIAWTKRHAHSPVRKQVVGAVSNEEPAVEVVAFPTQIRPDQPGEFRLRFGAAVTNVRVVFHYNHDRLEITGRDKTEDVFQHEFVEGGSREIAYELKAKDGVKGVKEEVDVVVCEGEGQLFAHAYPISIERASRWHSLVGKVTLGAAVTVAGFLVKDLPWQKIPEHFQAPAFESYMADFSTGKGIAWVSQRDWEFEGLGTHTIGPWPPIQNENAFHLTGDSRAIMLPSAFASSGRGGGRGILRNFKLTVAFQIAKGDNIEFLVHALRNSRGGWKQGYLFKLSLDPNCPNLPGELRKFSYLRLDAFQLPDLDHAKAFRSVEAENAPAFRVRPGPEDWYTLDASTNPCRAQPQSNRFIFFGYS